jgi:hypothetical protein
MHTGWSAPICPSLQVHKSRLHHGRTTHDIVRNLAAQRLLGVMFSAISLRMSNKLSYRPETVKRAVKFGCDVLDVEKVEADVSSSRVGRAKCAGCPSHATEAGSG